MAEVSPLPRQRRYKVNHQRELLAHRDELKEAFLQAYSRTGNVWASSRLIGISRRTIYNWRVEDPEFCRNMNDALDDAADVLEAEAHKRAMNGSDRLLEFLLRALRPEKFSERHDYYISQKYRGKTAEELRFLLAERLGQAPRSGAGGAALSTGTLPEDEDGM